MVIPGAMKEPYQNVSDLTVQDIQTAMANRNIALAEMKKRNEERAAQRNSTPAAGFGAPAANTGASNSPLAGLNMGGGFNF